jgi:hypothetical protein
MRRRDLLAVGAGWGLMLAGLVWALSTQFRWVQESRPLQKPPPDLLKEDEASGGAPATTGVTGTITDDSRSALYRALKARNASARSGPQPTRRVGQGVERPGPTPPGALKEAVPTPPRSRPSGSGSR